MCANFGGVPRVCIECRRDKALPPALPVKMHSDLPCRRVASIDTDHFLFFSSSKALAEHLLSPQF